MVPPEPTDQINPHIRLESADGSNIDCYGRRPYSIRLGRKQYNITAAISKTTDIILGMDFLYMYKFEFRWNEFGDLYLWDPKAQIKALCQFVKTNNSLPRVASISVAATWLPDFTRKPHLGDFHLTESEDQLPDGSSKSFPSFNKYSSLVDPQASPPPQVLSSTPPSGVPTPLSSSTMPPPVSPPSPSGPGPPPPENSSEIVLKWKYLASPPWKKSKQMKNQLQSR